MPYVIFCYLIMLGVWISSTSAKKNFSLDWRHKRLKNTENSSMDFRLSDLWKPVEKMHFTTKISIYTGHRHFEVLWSFISHLL